MPEAQEAQEQDGGADIVNLQLSVTRISEDRFAVILQDDKTITKSYEAGSNSVLNEIAEDLRKLGIVPNAMKR